MIRGRLALGGFWVEADKVVISGTVAEITVLVATVLVATALGPIGHVKAAIAHAVCRRTTGRVLDHERLPIGQGEGH